MELVVNTRVQLVRHLSHTPLIGPPLCGLFIYRGECVVPLAPVIHLYGFNPVYEAHPLMLRLLFRRRLPLLYDDCDPRLLTGGGGASSADPTATSSSCLT